MNSYFRRVHSCMLLLLYLFFAKYKKSLTWKMTTLRRHFLYSWKTTHLLSRSALVWHPWSRPETEECRTSHPYVYIMDLNYTTTRYLKFFFFMLSEILLQSAIFWSRCLNVNQLRGLEKTFNMCWIRKSLVAVKFLNIFDKILETPSCSIVYKQTLNEFVYQD